MDIQYDVEGYPRYEAVQEDAELRDLIAEFGEDLFNDVADDDVRVLREEAALALIETRRTGEMMTKEKVKEKEGEKVPRNASV